MQKTHAKPTPATTGMRANNFCRVHRFPRRMTENIIVKNGVEARTTWWNFEQEALSVKIEPEGHMTHWNSDKP